MSQLSVIGALAGVLIATLAPGGAVLAALGMRGLALGALAPAVSTALLGGGAVLAALVGLPWSWPAAVVVTTVSAAAALGIRRLLGAPGDLELPSRDRAAAVLAWCAAGVAALLAAVPMRVGMGGLRAAAQTPDGERHYGVLRLIDSTGNGSILTLFHPPHPLFPDLPPGGTRPGGWHDLVSVVMTATGADAVVAANASAIVLAAVVIPLGVGYLSAALLPRWRWAAPLGMLAGTAFAGLPTVVVSFGTLWPFAWATGLLPACLAALVLLLRARTWSVPALLVGIVALGGVAAAEWHVLGSFGLLALPLVLAAAGTRWRELHQSGSGRRMWTEVGGCAVVGVLLVVADVLLTAHRPPAAARTMSIAQGVGEALLDSPLSEQPFGVAAPAWLLGIAVVAGAWLALRTAGLRAWAVAWLLAVAVYALAAGALPDSPWRRVLTSWWFNDPMRLSTVVAVAAAPLVVVAVGGLCRWAAGRFPVEVGRRALVYGALGLVLVTLLSVQRADVREQRMRFDYTPRVAAAGEPGGR
jgi:hypothetical protein